MQQLLIGIILVLGLGGYWLYNENQTLTENNLKLEVAVKEQQEAIAEIQKQYEVQGKSLLLMTRKNAEIEADKAEYLEIFQKHNLDNLALRKPGLMENRFNNASVLVMEGLEDDTKALYDLNTSND
tara:strand:- start:1719 stop:2096 length:378 start_codon:yes stop_codon:yes gene_type:complete